MSLLFDPLLVSALLWSAWRTLATPDLARSGLACGCQRMSRRAVPMANTAARSAEVA